MPDQKNVFISHVHDDDAGLDELTSLVKRNGLHIRDYSINSDNPNNATSEAYIKTQILAPRIQGCDAMLVYISPKTKHSHYVNWEIEYAVKQGIPVIGVWARGENGCEVPEALQELGNAIVGWHGNSIIDAINGKITECQLPDGTPKPIQNIPRAEC